jgi:hypothetical protein
MSMATLSSQKCLKHSYCDWTVNRPLSSERLKKMEITSECNLVEAGWNEMTDVGGGRTACG